MKSRLNILQLMLVSCSLVANATEQQCDELLDQCYQLIKTKCSPDITLKSCCDLTSLSKAPSGVYQITTNCSCGSPFTAAVDAYCDMGTSDGGWMVIQRNNHDGVKTFNKKWKDYEEGFGDLYSGKLWYGLKALSCFTKTGQWELRVDFQFWNRTWSYLHYKQFKVGNTSIKYPLVIGGFTGITPGDPFEASNKFKFSTSDDDNDQNGMDGNCAAENYSGWWYESCGNIFPNFQPPYAYFNSTGYPLLSIEIKIRQCGCIVQ